MNPLNKTPTSEELLKLVGAGNADAWTAFDATYREPMLVYTRSRIPAGLRPQAEDIVQNVFVALARRMSDFKYESSRGRFRDYLARCIRNEIVDHLTAETRDETAKDGWREKLEAEAPPAQPFADSLLAEAVRRVRASGEDTTAEMRHIRYEPNLRRFRRAAGLSQSQLANESGVHLRSIQLYEQRVQDINRASAESLRSLAKCLSCTIEDIMENELSIR